MDKKKEINEKLKEILDVNVKSHLEFDNLMREIGQGTSVDVELKIKELQMRVMAIEKTAKELREELQGDFTIIEKKLRNLEARK